MALKKFIMYITRCGHTIRLPVYTSLGHQMSCLVCHKQTTIFDVQTLEWHATCNYHKCSFGAWTGLSQDLAEQAASRHERNAANHFGYVQVIFEQNPVAVERLIQLKKSGIL